MKNPWPSAAAALLAAALLPFPGGNARAASYYVAVTGSDSNPGTSASPFLTIQKGVNAAAAGDTIVVENGTYLYTGGAGGVHVSINTAGTAAARITLKAQNSGQAFLSGNGNLGGYGINFGASAAYWTIQGLDISQYNWAGVWSNSMGGNGIQILGNDIHNIGNLVNTSVDGEAGIYTDAGAANWTINGNVIHDVGRTSGLASANHDHGIYTHGSNMLVTNNVFYNARYGWHIQTAAGFGGTIANNTFFGPAGINAPGNVGSIVLWDSDASAIIEDNIFYDPLSDGITNVGASFTGTCAIDNNIVFNGAAGVGLIDSLPSGCVQSKNLLNVDPLLTTPAVPNYNFDLLAGSPAIGAGVVLAAVPLDFDGASRDSRDDVGAFEYAGAAAAAPPVVSVPAGCLLSSGTWRNAPLTSEKGFFTVQFSATPETADMDGVAGLSTGTASAFANLAAAVRFNDTGMIDARNGGVYAAGASIPYVAGMIYQFSLVVNVPAHVYSAYVAQGSNPQTLIGANYAFRTEQSSAASLSGFAAYADSGSILGCGAAVSVSASPTAISAVSASAIGPTAATIVWATNNPADSQVQFGATSAYGATTTLNSSPVTSHSVSLGGLTAGTVYHYRVLSRDAAGDLTTSPDATFTTLAPDVPPVVSGVSATGIEQTAATIVWTTDKPGDSELVYGLTSSYGSAAPVSAALTTSHSVALSGLTAGTLYHYAVGSRDAAGNIGTSADETFATSEAGACVTSAGAWQNAALKAETGSFTAQFDATPGSADMDGVVGLSDGAASAFTSQAAAVRFNNTGKIDARNGGAYAASVSIPYSAGASYHFRIVVNVQKRVYSAYVSRGTSAAQLIGANYAFRTEQKSASLLNDLAALADEGSFSVCNAAVSP